MKLRRLHRIVALASLLFIVTTVVTGLLWAYAPHLYWDAGYMARKHDAEAPDLAAARLGVQQALSRLTARFGDEVRITRLTLRRDAGQLLYDLRYATPSGERHTALLNAVSGVWLSPLDEAGAVRFARQYVHDDPAVAEAVLLPDWTHRKSKTDQPAWRVTFADAAETEIFIDPYSGALLEDQDKVRRFHFLIMRLHQFKFLGTNKELTALAGLPLLVLISTGLWLAAPRRRSRRKGRLGGGQKALVTSAREKDRVAR